MKTVKDLADALSKVVPLNKGDTEDAIKILFKDIQVAVESGEDVRIRGFGTFKLKHRAARKGRNPSNGDQIDIPASSTMVFKATKHGK